MPRATLPLTFEVLAAAILLEAARIAAFKQSGNDALIRSVDDEEVLWHFLSGKHIDASWCVRRARTGQREIARRERVIETPG